MPNRLRAAFCLTWGSRPSNSSAALVGFSNVVSIFMVVVFPAPLGARKAKISPSSTSNETSFTAVNAPPEDLKVFTRFRTRIIHTSGLTDTERFSSACQLDLCKGYLGYIIRDTYQDHHSQCLL